MERHGIWGIEKVSLVVRGQVKGLEKVGFGKVERFENTQTYWSGMGKHCL